ncbi:transient-receptor-potential-like protein [Diadema antillarum]|uniref:transient-receptor-potential-like protein n=1 Tax=Diadema antillarum TaxID=105358 RepID=UPI003A86F242
MKKKEDQRGITPGQRDDKVDVIPAPSLPYDQGLGNELLTAVDVGDLLKVEDLLTELKSSGRSLDIRDNEGLNAYAHAISEGLLSVVISLLRAKAPLGDALLRATAASFEDAVKVICSYTKTLPKEEREEILECHCDNDDFHRSMTPLKMAAIRNNFVTVQLLLSAGARPVVEPKLEGLADATLSEVVEYLDIYRALSSEAYLGLAYQNALGNAFRLTGRLRKIAGVWEAVNSEFYAMADGVEKFAASLLDYIANSYELRTLFRQRVQKNVTHEVSQIQTAVDYQQKQFVAHAYTQKMLGNAYYRSLQAIGPFLLKLVTVLSIIGYPFICLAYLLVQGEKLEAFLRIPHVKMCLFFGADLAFLACTSAVIVSDEDNVLLFLLLLLFCLALSWKHVCAMFQFGLADVTGDPMIGLEVLLVGMTYVVMMCKGISGLMDIYLDRTQERYDDRLSLIVNRSVVSAARRDSTIQASLDWDDPNVVANTVFGVVVILSVMRAFNTILKTYHDMFFIWEATVGAVRDIAKFLIIFFAYLLAFSVGLFAVHSVQVVLDDSRCDDSYEYCGLADPSYRSIPVSMLTLWWWLNGFGNRPPWLTSDLIGVIHVVLILIYLVVVLVLINTLVAMLGSRFAEVEGNSQTEWKFGRTKLWLQFIQTDISIPPPFNLLPTSGYVIRRLKKCFTSSSIKGSSKTEPEKPSTHSDEGDPRAVMKLILNRYNTTNIEKPADDDCISTDDVRAIREDFVTVKFNIQTQLRIVEEMLTVIEFQSDDVLSTLPTMDGINDRCGSTRSSLGDIYSHEYPVLDVDMDNIQEVILDVEEELMYEPKVPVKVPPPKDPPKRVKSFQMPPKKPPELKRHGSLALLMASMFEGGRTIDVDHVVKEELELYREKGGFQSKP